MSETVPLEPANTELVRTWITPANPLGLERRQIRVQKADGRAILPSRRNTALKRLDDFESELGRLKRLATELRADILALTVE